MHRFELDDYTRWRLMEGLDDIGLTLRHEGAIDDYEPTRRPGCLRVGDVVTATWDAVSYGSNLAHHRAYDDALLGSCSCGATRRCSTWAAASATWPVSPPRCRTGR